MGQQLHLVPCTLDVEQCTSCGGDHPGTWFQVCTEIEEDKTHWTLCPGTGDIITMRTGKNWKNLLREAGVNNG